MFADAVALARKFTRPVVTAVLYPDGSLGSMLGAFVIVNADGWILTANHILDGYTKLADAKQRYAEYEQQRADIQQNPGLLSEQKKTRLRKLGPPPKDAIRDFAFWWGDDQWQFSEAHAVDQADLALCKLENFTGISTYPTFKDPSKGVDPGTSLCRLGFPFTDVTVTHNGTAFSVDASKAVFFPNEGMFTRTITFSTNPLVAHIETSSPGLRGQSGGPIFDRKGIIWGIQSVTGHLALGFSPAVPNGKVGEVEHQFLNVGRGAHPETMANLLQGQGIAFSLSSY
jgi:S1-C subfamily serine protease